MSEPEAALLSNLAARFITSFMSLLRFWGVIGGLLIITVILYVYSYLVYRRVVGDEGGPFSPPFDRQS